MPGLATMTTEECWRRLGSEGVGRVGFDRGRGPRIHPINYTVVDGSLYVRTTEGSEFGIFVRMFADGALVSFEADQLHDLSHERWSVLVVARVSRLDPALLHRLLPGRMPVPAPAGARPVVVRLDPVEVGGRRLVEGEQGAGERAGQDPGRLARRIPSNWLG